MLLYYQLKAFAVRLNKNCIFAKYEHESGLRGTPSINDIKRRNPQSQREQVNKDFSYQSLLTLCFPMYNVHGSIANRLGRFFVTTWRRLRLQYMY